MYGFLDLIYGVTGSEEEVEDLKAAYKEHKGDMEGIIDTVLCATIDDEDRFTDLLTDLIAKKELPKYKAFTKETSQKKTARRKRVWILMQEWLELF